MSAMASNVAFRALIAPSSKQGLHTRSRSAPSQCGHPVVCKASQSGMTSDVDRRATLFGLAAAVVSTQLQLPAMAQEYEVFYGAATPPTSYGGYGGFNAVEDAKYTFEYPVGWKSAAPNKVEKGTQGIDCRVFNPRNRGQQITVVTFGRAGEDNKSFRLNDIETTIAGFAGADYDLQDALGSATNKINSEREVDGQLYYDIQIDSPDVTYLSSVTVNMGKVYALFIKSPTKAFKGETEEALRHTAATFKTL